MQKTLLLSIVILLSPLNADTTNMSEQALINQFMQLEKQIQKEKQRQASARIETDRKRKELEDVRKLGRTVDKLAEKLGVDK